jgi:hypothetical protein
MSPEPRSRARTGGAAAASEPEARADRRGVVLTGRGALLAMFGVFLLGLLASEWLGRDWLAGVTFLAGSVGAACYTRRSDLLAVAVSPPLLFCCALLLARALTSHGSLFAAVAGGSLLTLAEIAPWLFAGVVLSLIIGWARGLGRCISDLRKDLSLREPAAARGAGRPDSPVRRTGAPE